MPEGRVESLWRDGGGRRGRRKHSSDLKGIQVS